MVRRVIAGVMFLAVAMLAAGCGSSEQATTITGEERFAAAKKLFDKEDYLEAINEFTVITLQFQGASYAADAQYYLAECRFLRGEYLLAAFEFGVLKRNYPASPRVADGQFMLGECYYNLAPKSALDQQYTRKAIDEYQTFAEYYPANEKAAQAGDRIKELNVRLAKKEYDTAILYVKMEYTKAAIFYFDDVIEKYHDSEYAPLAFLSKAELLISRNKPAEASAELAKFIDRYPNSVLRARADALKKTADEAAQAKAAATRPSAGTVPVIKGTMN